jgi:hypothetical protein
MSLCTIFGWLSSDIINKTFQHTTQYASLPTLTTLKTARPQYYRSQRGVTCEIIYYNVPDIDNGSIAAVILVGTENQVTDNYGTKSDRPFVNTMEDYIT